MVLSWRNLGHKCLLEKLKGLRNTLKKWNKDIFGNIDNGIKALEEEEEKNDLLLEVNGEDEVLLARRYALIGQLDL